MKIEPVGLHWVGEDTTRDLCAHGGIRVLLEDRVVLVSSYDGHALSTAAFNLLRSLEADHRSSDGTLIPCCGHYMGFDEAGRLGNAADHGGSGGDAWTVTQRREAGLIEVDLDNGAPAVVIDERVWRGAVLGLCRDIGEFFHRSPAKVPTRDDEVWYAAMREEWERRAGFAL